MASLSYLWDKSDPNLVAYYKAGQTDARMGNQNNRPVSMGGTDGVNSRQAYDDGYTSVAGVDENSPDSQAYYKAGQTDARMGNQNNRPGTKGPEWDVRRAMYDKGYASVAGTTAPPANAEADAYYKAGKLDASMGNRNNYPTPAGPEWDIRRISYNKGQADYYNPPVSVATTPLPSAVIPAVTTQPASKPTSTAQTSDIATLATIFTEQQTSQNAFMMQMLSILKPTTPTASPLPGLGSNASDTSSAQTAGFDFATLKTVGPIIVTLLIVSFLFGKGK